MIVSCTKLIRYFNHLVKQSKSEEVTDFDSVILYQQLFEPFIEVWNNIDDFQPETVEASLNIIGKVCVFSKETATDLIDIIWPHLNQLACIAIPDSNISSKLIELILNAMAKIQVKFEYDKISPQIEEIFNLMTQRGRIEDCFFIYFAKLAKNFNEIREIYEQIHQQIVLPFILVEDFASSEMFKLINKFDFEIIDIEWFTEILIETIKNMGIDVVYTGIKTFISLINKNVTRQLFILFIQNLSEDLIKTIIEAILDLLHKLLLFKFSELINTMISNVNNINKTFEYMNANDEDKKKLDDEQSESALILKNIISSTLFGLYQEPQDGFFNDFVEFLFTHGTAFEIMDAFSNLLIILRKASPCDFDGFKLEQIVVVDNDDDFIDDDHDSNFNDFFDDIDSENDLL